MESITLENFKQGLDVYPLCELSMKAVLLDVDCPLRTAATKYLEAERLFIVELDKLDIGWTENN